MAGVQDLQPGLRRIVAPNPSPMTEAGTNTYLVGSGEVAVIDPGPDIGAHFEAVLAALRPGERITHIFVTHSHLDHSALVPGFTAQTGAQVHAYGDSTAGQSAHLRKLAQIGGGEGVDRAFAPDRSLDHGEVVAGASWEIRAHWTPGHFGNHMTFEWNGVAFTGDTVMGWAPSLVSPPDGDLSAFMASLEYLRELGARRFYPGHGAAIEHPAQRIDELRSHRRMRERQIVTALRSGPSDTAALTARIYSDIPASLHAAARRNVLAHLVDLASKSVVEHDGPLTETTVFRLS